MNRRNFYIAFIFAALFPCAPAGADAAYDTARTMFQRLLTNYTPADEPTVRAMAVKIAAGDRRGAAALVTPDARFVDYGVVPLGLRVSSVTGSASTPYNSVVALLQLLTRAGIDPGSDTAEDGADNPGDIRQWLYADMAAEIQAPAGSSVTVPPRTAPDDNGFHVDEVDHYRTLAANGWSAKAVLHQHRPQYEISGHSVKYAGLFTLGAMQHLYLAGTNRRPVSYTFSRLLCRKMEQVHDLSVPDGFVRRDVDHRQPNYGNRCIGCHGILDALSTAFVFLDSNGRILFRRNVADKYTRNQGIYPAGYNPGDVSPTALQASWVNYATANQNTTFGWHGATSGVNANEYGRMMANSDGFADCLAQNVWQDVCRRDMTSAEIESVRPALVRDGLKSTGYRLHKLYEVVAAHPACLGGG